MASAPDRLVSQLPFCRTIVGPYLTHESQVIMPSMRSAQTSTIQTRICGANGGYDCARADAALCNLAWLTHLCGNLEGTRRRVALGLSIGVEPLVLNLFVVIRHHLHHLWHENRGWRHAIRLHADELRALAPSLGHPRGLIIEGTWTTTPRVPVSRL